MKPERIQSAAAAEMLGVTSAVVQGNAAYGNIPKAAKIGRIWTFDTAAIEALAAELKKSGKRLTRKKPIRRREPGWSVYVFKRLSVVKVGISKNVDQRLAGLLASGGGAMTCEFRARVPLDAIYAVEAEAHAKLRTHALNNEWFSCSVEMAVEAVNVSIHRNTSRRLR